VHAQRLSEKKLKNRCNYWKRYTCYFQRH